LNVPEYLPSPAVLSGETPLSYKFIESRTVPFARYSLHVTKSTGSPPFKSTLTEVLKFINGTDDVVKTVSFEI